MPIYEYECSKGHRFEVIQKIAEEPLTKCTQCEAEAHRVMSGAGFVFKGGGFTKTDYPSESRKKAQDKEVKAKFQGDLQESRKTLKPQVG